jgi:PII-like signaling protein
MVRLRIYCGSNDVCESRPLIDALVYRARELGLAGATGFQGIIGYGSASALHCTELILSRDLPIVVELVDRRDKIDTYLADVEPMLTAGLVTVEPVTVLRQGAAAKEQA